MAGSWGEAQAQGLNLGLFDKQAHLIVSFQATVTTAKLLQELQLSKSNSALASSVLLMGAAFLKERKLDSVFDSTDLWATAIGSMAGILSILAMPHPSEGSFEDRPITLDAEGGAITLFPILNTGEESSPPATTMLHGQTTFWFRQKVGFHLYSGGIEPGGLGHGSKKLLFGAGVRAWVWPFLGEGLGKHKPLSVWVGLDYGHLLFATSDLSMPYTQSSYGPMGSIGLKWKPFRGKLFLGTQLSLAPYPSTLLMGAALQGGLEL